LSKGVILLVQGSTYYYKGLYVATSVKIDEELKERIQHLAEARQRSPHWIMCEAIRDYVDREEVRENFKQEALDSWASYKETGQHLTGEETRAWLAKWGTEHESSAPACHE
jgi:predicted transcriptional regulator